MSSLRKPIKIIIVGNDTKEYPFLIKFGEDVRQDQRIQQLFGIMNTIFGNNKKLMDSSFLLWTYQVRDWFNILKLFKAKCVQVIPLTSKLGFIQWVDDTTPLQSFITAVMANPTAFSEAQKLYSNAIYKKQNLAPVDAYGRAALNLSRDKTISKYRELVYMIQWDILRLAFF